MIMGTGNNIYWLGLDAGAGTGSAFCLGAGGGSTVGPPPGV